jgi:hypothetical protein
MTPKGKGNQQNWNEIRAATPAHQDFAHIYTERPDPAKTREANKFSIEFITNFSSEKHKSLSSLLIYLLDPTLKTEIEHGEVEEASTQLIPIYMSI